MNSTLIYICHRCDDEYVNNHFDEDNSYIEIQRKHIKNIIQEYITPDPADVIVSYISRIYFTCHYCRQYYTIRMNIAEQLLQIMTDARIRYMSRFITTPLQFLAIKENYMDSEYNIKFVVGYKTIKHKTFLKCIDIYRILTDVGIITLGKSEYYNCKSIENKMSQWSHIESDL